MPNLELGFHVHDQGFKWKSMRRGKIIGHRDPDGNHRRKFTKRHYRLACQAIANWMLEYNAMIDKPEPVVDKKCDSRDCFDGGGCECR